MPMRKAMTLRHFWSLFTFFLNNSQKDFWGLWIPRFWPLSQLCCCFSVADWDIPAFLWSFLSTCLSLEFKWSYLINNPITFVNWGQVRFLSAFLTTKSSSLDRHPTSNNFYRGQVLRSTPLSSKKRGSCSEVSFFLQSGKNGRKITSSLHSFELMLSTRNLMWCFIFWTSSESEFNWVLES